MTTVPSPLPVLEHRLLALRRTWRGNVFTSLLLPIMFLLGMVFSNFNSLAMEPQGEIAGTASSLFGSITTVMAAVLGYLVGQMAAGSLRQMHPILAIQSFAAPIIVHVLLRPVVSEGLGLELDSEAAVREFATNWVRGMAPDPPEDVP